MCRHLDERVEATLFSSITVDVSLHGADTTAAQLEALALGTTRASHFAKILKIRSLNPALQEIRNRKDGHVPGDYEAEEPMVQIRKNCRRAIMSLKNVTTVSSVTQLRLFLYYLHFL